MYWQNDYETTKISRDVVETQTRELISKFGAHYDLSEVETIRNQIDARAHFLQETTPKNI